MSGDGERRAGSRTPQIRNEGRATTATLEVPKKEDVDEVHVAIDPLFTLSSHEHYSAYRQHTAESRWAW